MKTNEQYIQQLAEEFELPVEQVALVESVLEFVCTDADLAVVLGKLFPV